MSVAGNNLGDGAVDKELLRTRSSEQEGGHERETGGKPRKKETRKAKQEQKKQESEKRS